MVIVRAFFFILLGAWPAMAQERSVVTVPIKIPLASLQAYSERAIPRTLVDEGSKEDCPFSCNVTQRVVRQGELSITGQDGSLVLRQSFNAWARAKGRNFPFKDVQQTARGTLALEVTTRPSLAPDWTPKLSPVITYTWTKRPQVRLFNLIKLTFAGKANEVLDREIAKFRSQTLPAELAKLDVRGKMVSLWARLQEPIRLDIPGSAALYLHFRPDAVGLDGPEVVGNDLAATLSIGGDLSVTDSASNEVAPTPLPDLGSVGSPGFSLDLPVTVALDTLTEALSASLPYTVDTSDSGIVLIVTDMHLAESAGRLIVTADVEASLGVLRYAGPVVSSATLDYEAPQGVLKMREFIIDATSDNLLEAAAGKVVTSALSFWLRDRMSLDLATLVDDVERRLNAELNRTVAPGVRLNGTADIAVQSLRLASGLNLHLAATGVLAIDVTPEAF